MQKFDFELLADYFQFYLQDEAIPALDPQAWTAEAVTRLLAVGNGFLMVGTVRNMPVTVSVEILESEPSKELSKWDQVNECSLEVSTGRMVVAGCTDYFPDAARIAVSPGWHRARISYGNLDSVSEDGLKGDDFYKLSLWPAASPLPLTVLKQRKMAVKG